MPPAALVRRSPGFWPLLLSFLELDADDSAPRLARRHIIPVLRTWGLEAIEDDAALVVSDSLN